MSKERKLEQMIELIKDEKKRDLLRSKLEKLRNNKKTDKRKGGSGMLQDVFNYNLKGHIKVDQIDKEGNVINNLVDKDNLVVNGADEIVLRSLSGDSGRMIFKNRKPIGGSQEVLISSHKLNNKNIIEGGKIIHDPSTLWSEADDSLFDVTYSYYPEVVFIEEVTSGLTGFHKFVVYSSTSASRLPLSAEVYSTYTNAFIGLGEGKGKAVDLAKLKIKKNAEADVDQSKDEIVLNKEQASMEFTTKGTRVDFTFKKGKNGGNVGIYINDDLKETVKTSDLTADEDETLEFELKGLPHDEEVKIKLVHAGAEAGVVAPVVTVVRISTDQLSKEMTGMFREFQTLRTKFDTTIYLNTTPEAPFTAAVPHHPVKPETLVVMNRNKKLQASKSLETLDKNEYFYDEVTGQLHFFSALTDVGVQYEITGEVAKKFDKATITTSTLTHLKVEEQPKEIGVTIVIPSGVNPLYNLTKTNVKREGLVVKIDGVPVEDSDIITFNSKNGTFRLAQSVSSSLTGSTITADFVYDLITPIQVEVNKMTLPNEVDQESFKLNNQDGRKLEKAEDVLSLTEGTFMFDNELTSTAPDSKVVYFSKTMEEDSEEESDLVKVVFTRFVTEDFKGHQTNYKRALIEKPKSEQKYPWFQFDTGSIRFVAQFPENDILENLTIREMALFDGPKAEDNFEGYNDFPVKAFSVVRLPETVKNITTGIQVTWTITLLDEKNNHYKGGNN